MNLHRKPWSIIILAFIQLLTPVSDILLGAIRYKVTPWRFLEGVVHAHQWHQLVEIFALAPLAGLAVLAVRWWSYPIFLGTLFWTAASNYMVWRDHPESVSLALLFACYGLNILFVSYFLIPSVRQVYFNPRIRWWETKPRYFVEMPASVKIKGKEKACTILNISEGGSSVETSTKIAPGTPISLRFTCFNREFHVGGEIVYQLKPSTQTAKKYTYGVQFVFTRTTKHEIFQAVRAFNLLGIERRPRQEDNITSFKLWVIDGLHTMVDYIQHDHAGHSGKHHQSALS